MRIWVRRPLKKRKEKTLEGKVIPRPPHWLGCCTSTPADIAEQPARGVQSAW